MISNRSLRIPILAILCIVSASTAGQSIKGQLYLPKPQDTEFRKGSTVLFVFDPENDKKVPLVLKNVSEIKVDNAPAEAQRFQAILIERPPAYNNWWGGLWGSLAYKPQSYEDYKRKDPSRTPKPFEVALVAPQEKASVGGGGKAGPGAISKEAGGNHIVENPRPGFLAWLGWALAVAVAGGVGVWIGRKWSPKPGKHADHKGQSDGVVRGPNEQVFEELGVIKALVKELQKSGEGDAANIRKELYDVRVLAEHNYNSLQEALERLRVQETEFESLKGIARSYQAANSQLREDNARLTSRIEELQAVLDRGHGDQMEAIVRSSSATESGFQETFRRLANFPMDPRPANLGEKMRRLVEAAEGKSAEMRRGGHGLDVAFTDQCLGELREMARLFERLQDPSWKPEDDLIFHVSAVYAPRRPVETSDLSRANTQLLRSLQFECDELRTDLKEGLRAKFDLQELPVVPNVTRFDPNLHDDFAGQRRPTNDPDQANMVFERVRPGFRREGQLVQKAIVKRYVLAVAPPPGSPDGGPAEPRRAPTDEEAGQRSTEPDIRPETLRDEPPVPNDPPPPEGGNPSDAIAKRLANQ